MVRIQPRRDSLSGVIWPGVPLCEPVATPVEPVYLVCLHLVGQGADRGGWWVSNAQSCPQHALMIQTVLARGRGDSDAACVVCLYGLLSRDEGGHYPYGTVGCSAVDPYIAARLPVIGDAACVPDLAGLRTAVREWLAREHAAECDAVCPRPSPIGVRLADWIAKVGGDGRAGPPA